MEQFISGLNSETFCFKKYFICQLKNIKFDEIDSIYNFSDKLGTITKVEIVGVIRNINARTNKVLIICDDGTGIITVIKFMDNICEDNLNSIELQIGDLISVKGLLVCFETNELPFECGIKVSLIEKLIDPNLELLFWANTMYLQSQND